jgi:hypothetical protein
MNAISGALGASNGGVFSRGEALDCGESDKSLAAACRGGDLVRLRHGMYVAAPVFHAAEDVGRHLLYARAALAAQRGKVALTGASAAALHGFAIYQQDLSIVHLLRLDGGSSHHSGATNHHRLHRDVNPDEVGSYAGLPSVTPARAVWEVGCTSSLEAGVVTADAALRCDPSLRQAVAELNDRFAHVPGSRGARLALRLANPLAESPGESVTRVQFFRYGIPAPTLQQEIRDDRGRLIGRVDFGWEEFRHLAEFDGKVKYESLLRPGESASDCVFREKRREDELRALRHGMTRIVWAMVMRRQSRASMAELRASLEQSRRLYVPGYAVAS